MIEHANASPAKQFFIRMIVKDISLEDCLLDLIDNSIDGALRLARPGDSSLANCQVDLNLSHDSFRISDNCGGIPVSLAKDYAFRFGRETYPPPGVDDSIGVYGIGMKRAIFKLGNHITITSSTSTESFRTTIDVPEWELLEPWTFDLDISTPSEVPGVTIAITDLHEGISKALADSVFIEALKRSIAIDYSLFLQRGLIITVNGHTIVPQTFKLLHSASFRPGKSQYKDGDVTVTIAAGLAAPPSDDDSPEASRPHYERYGWYVLCNDRVVLAADKTRRTVWGHGEFQHWHNQYNGFLGIVSFNATDPSLLPWITTKRDLDPSVPLYRRAVRQMKDFTRPYIEYTNRRKGREQEAKKLEKEMRQLPLETLDDVEPPPRPTVPPLVTERVRMANILYRRPVEQVKQVGEALGNRNMTYKDVGEATFDYYLEQEVVD